jgi:hypothetical protein
MQRFRKGDAVTYTAPDGTVHRGVVASCTGALAEVAFSQPVRGQDRLEIEQTDPAFVAADTDEDKLTMSKKERGPDENGPEAAFIAILQLIPLSTTPDLRAIRDIATAALVRLGMDADHVTAIYHP